MKMGMFELSFQRWTEVGKIESEREFSKKKELCGRKTLQYSLIKDWDILTSKPFRGNFYNSVTVINCPFPL